MNFTNNWKGPELGGKSRFRLAMIVEGVAQAHVQFHILAAVIKPEHFDKNVELDMSLSDAFDDHSKRKQLFPLSFGPFQLVAVFLRSEIDRNTNF